jgi:calcyclin binding protein
VVLSLRKAPGKYGPEHWSGLVARTKPQGKASDKSDPTAGINDLLKQMYDDGDETMRKTIGEAMLKSRQGGAPSFD